MSNAPAAWRPEFITVVLNQSGRACFGRLYFAPDGLRFLCLKDESAAAAAAGKATARQFGLIGALAGAAVGAVKGNAREKAIAEVLAQQEGLTLDQRLQQHPLSRTWPRDALVRFSVSAWTGTFLETREGKVPILELGPDEAAHLVSWCTEKDIPAQQPSKMNPKVKLALWLSPVALVLLYAGVAFPFALQKQAHADEVKRDYDVMVAQAEKSWASLERPVGARLEAACGQAVKSLTDENVIGFIGELPEQPERERDFPMIVTTSGGYAFGDGLPQSYWDQGFGDHYGDILTEAPTDWGRRASECYPRCAIVDATTLIVTRVHALEGAGPEGRGGGTMTFSTRVEKLGSGETICEGDHAVRLLGYSQAEAIRAGSLSALCLMGGDTLCERLAEKAQDLP